MKEGDVFHETDTLENKTYARVYNFTSTWGLPVRHHDINNLVNLTNPKFVEFHLSYKDLELEHGDFLRQVSNEPNCTRARII